jgi:hypothetical protein
MGIGQKSLENGEKVTLLLTRIMRNIENFSHFLQIYFHFNNSTQFAYLLACLILVSVQLKLNIKRKEFSFHLD